MPWATGRFTSSRFALPVIKDGRVIDPTLPAQERDTIVREVEETDGQITRASVAARLRDRVAATGEGKRIGRTTGEIRKLFESLTGPGEDPAVASFAGAIVDY